ncbi:MAG: hypothetical protein JW825_04750 [Candidatus Methanofastidiosa archaeon]|nr:hypothetical protein [Candidatus Methanofastidiosa archaeon]
MPLGDGTGPLGLGPRGQGRGNGRGACRNPNGPAYEGLDERTYLESAIKRLEAQLQIYRKRLDELK